MLLGSIHTADLSVRDREVRHLTSLDPDTTAILSRYVRVETLVGVVAGIAMAAAGGIMAAVQSSSSWWGLVPVVVGAALSGGAWVRSRHWVTKVRRSLLSPGHASTWSARFGRVPLRRYPQLPGLVYANLSRSSAVRGAPPGAAHRRATRSDQATAGPGHRRRQFARRVGADGNHRG